MVNLDLEDTGVARYAKTGKPVPKSGNMRATGRRGPEYPERPDELEPDCRKAGFGTNIMTDHTTQQIYNRPPEPQNNKFPHCRFVLSPSLSFSLLLGSPEEVRRGSLCEVSACRCLGPE